MRGLGFAFLSDTTSKMRTGDIGPKGEGRIMGDDSTLGATEAK